MPLLPTPTSINTLQSSSSSTPSSSPISSQCGFPANPDLYGPGIRLGIYAQFLAVWFANYFLASEIHVLRDTVTIFSIAILVVVVLFVARPGEVYAVEGFVLLQILVWGCIMGVRGSSAYTSVARRGSFVRRTINICVDVWNWVLQAWFWWVGVTKMKRTPCGTWMMYGWRVSMYGWARTLMMVLNLWMVGVVMFWAVVDLGRMWAVRKLEGVEREVEDALEMWEEAQRRRREGVATGEKEPGESEKCGESGNGVAQEDRDLADAIRRTSTDGSMREGKSLSREATLVVQSSPKASSMSHDEDCASKAANDPLEKPDAPSTAQRTVEASPQSPAPDIVLQKILKSEAFLQHCVQAAPLRRGSAGDKPMTPLRFFRIILSSKATHRSSDSEQSDRLPTLSEFLRCEYNIYKAMLTLRCSPQFFVLLAHLRHASAADVLNIGFQLNAGLDYPLVSDLPSWPYVLFASNLLTASSATPKRVWEAWYMTLKDLLIHIIVIVQIELTLVWNHVSGLTNLWSSVGQLIPFVIGMSGLSLVISRWVKVKWDKRKRKLEKSSGREQKGRSRKAADYHAGDLGVDDVLRDRWERWKETRHRPEIVAV